MTAPVSFVRPMASRAAGKFPFRNPKFTALAAGGTATYHLYFYGNTSRKPPKGGNGPSGGLMLPSKAVRNPTVAKRPIYHNLIYGGVIITFVGCFTAVSVLYGFIDLNMSFLGADVFDTIHKCVVNMDHSKFNLHDLKQTPNLVKTGGSISTRWYA